MTRNTKDPAVKGTDGTLEKVKYFMDLARSTEGFCNVGFVIFHGSAEEGRALPDSDIDICVHYEGSPEEQWNYRLSLLKELPDIYDIQIFQKLPLHVKREVLKGKPVYVKDKNLFQQIVKETRSEYEAVRPRIARQLKEGEAGETRIDLIHNKLEEAEKAMKEIEEYLPQTYGEYKNLGIIKSGIYKETEHAIECLIDVCAVINADQSLGKPSDVDDILTNLVNAGILHKEAGNKIRELKGFRNVLVHKYGKIDDKLAYADIKEGLTDIRSVITGIRNGLGIRSAEASNGKN